VTIPLTSDAYVLAAAEALEQASRTSTDAMSAHTRRASVLLEMARLLAECEAAQLALPEPALPAAFLDCHDRRWEQMGDDGDYRRTGSHTAPPVPMHIISIREAFGPLREAKS
jgi:hypothetical protein